MSIDRDSPVDRAAELVLNMPIDQLTKLFHLLLSVEVKVEMVEIDDSYNVLDWLDAEKINFHAYH